MDDQTIGSQNMNINRGYLKLIFGDSRRRKARYVRLYGEEDSDCFIHDNRRKMMRQWIGALVFSGLVGLLLVLAQLLNPLSNSILHENGGYILYFPKGWADSISLEVEMTLGDDLRKSNISLKPFQEERNDISELHKNPSDQIFHQAERELRQWANSTKVDSRASPVQLPEKSSEGVVYHWGISKENNYLLLPLIPIGFVVFLFFQRDQDLRRKELESNESVQNQLIPFVTRLVLLMEAGMVVSGALERMMSEYKRWHHINQRKDYFIQQMVGIDHRVHETKGDYVKEIKGFSHRLGNPDFIRIMGIIEENKHKGTELSQKLLMETRSLWEKRKKSAIERGRVAESKLTFPLMLQIISLILVTIAPVFIEM